MANLANSRSAYKHAGWTATPWPNGLGWDVVAPTGRHYELWPSGSIVLCRADDSLCGYAGVQYCETGCRNVTPAINAIDLVRAAVSHMPWQACYQVLWSPKTIAPTPMPLAQRHPLDRAYTEAERSMLSDLIDSACEAEELIGLDELEGVAS